MNLFDPLVQVFRLVFEGFYNLTAAVGFANYGIAIILMTILVKALMYPLTAKQVRSMKAMQELQPALKKLQKDYKNNPQLLQQKMAELYKEAGVNPLAGCLPLLIQMPILMGVYYCLYGYSYSGDPTFLWHTRRDQAVPVMNTLLYAQALAEKDVPFAVHIYPEGWHGLATVDHTTNNELGPAVMHAKDWLHAAEKWLSFTF